MCDHEKGSVGAISGLTVDRVVLEPLVGVTKNRVVLEP